jgi:hypothetical protein
MMARLKISGISPVVDWNMLTFETGCQKAIAFVGYKLNLIVLLLKSEALEIVYVTILIYV